jgi:hypothetical protein
MKRIINTLIINIPNKNVKKSKILSNNKKFQKMQCANIKVLKLKKEQSQESSSIYNHK